MAMVTKNDDNDDNANDFVNDEDYVIVMVRKIT